MINDWQGFMIFLLSLCGIVIVGGILAIFYLDKIFGAIGTVLGIVLFSWVYWYGVVKQN